ncbi:MAG: acyl--CoA ligase [Opitutales bacterium]|nr:acyl--CoA ligase [Opitutales bacterium]
MFVSPENLFVEKIPDYAAFKLELGDVKFSRFASQVGKAAAFFERQGGEDFILRIEGGIADFAALFFGLMQAGKRALLPSSEKMAADFAKASGAKIVSDSPALDGEIFPRIKSLPGAAFEFKNMRRQKVCFFTSGSTSAPKMIEKTFATLSDETQNSAEVLGKFDGCAVASTCEPFHLYGMLWRLLYPLATQTPIHAATIKDPETLAAVQRQSARAIFVTTPSFIEAVARHKELYSFPQNIAAITTSGGLLKKSASQSAKEIWGKYPVEIFGSTESGGIASRCQGESQTWKVFDRVEISADERGCLCAKSPYCLGGFFRTNDLAKILSPKAFEFCGRIDRIVKIGETQLSLPDLENAVLENKFVEGCHADFSENTLRALIAPSAEGKNFLLEKGRAKFLSEINSALKKTFDAKFALRKIRALNKIPMNAQGKILKSEVRKIFNSKLEEPIILSEGGEENSPEKEMFFPAESSYFKGHFPIAKILPGAVQLHFAAKFIRESFGVCPRLKAVKRLKFTNIIRPGERILLALKKDSENNFSFAYTKRGSPCSSGALEFENA